MTRITDNTGTVVGSQVTFHMRSQCITFHSSNHFVLPGYRSHIVLESPVPIFHLKEINGQYALQQSNDAHGHAIKRHNIQASQ